MFLYVLETICEQEQQSVFCWQSDCNKLWFYNDMSEGVFGFWSWNANDDDSLVVWINGNNSDWGRILIHNLVFIPNKIELRYDSKLSGLMLE